MRSGRIAAMSAQSTRNESRCSQCSSWAMGQGERISVRSKPRDEDFVCGLTIRPCSRAGGIGRLLPPPSRTNRTSVTWPSGSSPYTSAPSRSLRIMAPPGNAPDDVVTHPTLCPCGVERLTLDGESDHDADVLDGGPRDPLESRWRRTATENPGTENRSAQQRNQLRCGGAKCDVLDAVDIGDFQIGHRGHRHRRDVMDLSVEKMQLGIEHPTSGRFGIERVLPLHRPAPVMIISGMAANEAATITPR